MPNDASLDQKVTSVTVVFILVVVAVAFTNCCHCGNIINAGIFIVTTALVAVAYYQLEILKKQTNATFLLTFNREFFDKKQNQKIIATIEEEEPLLVDNGGKFTLYQLDDYLGYFELMALFEKRGVIDFKLIDEMFGHYITCAHKNKEIAKYIEDLRANRKDDTYYEHFYDLVGRVEEMNKVRRLNSR